VTAPLVTTKTDSKLGTILADGNGMTLYTLTSGGKPIACNATCAGVWPPLGLPSGVTAPTGAAGITDLGTAAGADGTMLITHQGLPLYRFSGDRSSADASGEGLQSFGGIWHVAKVQGASTATTSRGGTVTTTPTTRGSASTTPTTSGSGY
jgi:predicted lipoprotein with Yx(FWY)xxD motif